MSQTIQTLHDLVTPKALEATQDFLGSESAKTDALTALYALMATRLTHADTVERTESLTEEQLQDGDTLLDSLFYDGVTTVALPASVYGAIAGRLSLPVTTVAKLSEAALPDAYGYIKIIADDKPVNAHLAQESLELLNTIPAWLAALLPTGLLTITKDEILAAQSTQDATKEADTQDDVQQDDTQANNQDKGQDDNQADDQDVTDTQDSAIQSSDIQNADVQSNDIDQDSIIQDAGDVQSQEDAQTDSQNEYQDTDGVSSLGVLAGVATAGVLGALTRADEVQEETTQEAIQDTTEEVAQEITQEIAQVQDEIGGELETAVSEQAEVQPLLGETSAQLDDPQTSQDVENDNIQSDDAQNVDIQNIDAQNDDSESNDVQDTQEQTDEPVADTQTVAKDEQETAQLDTTNKPTEAFAGIALGAVAAAAAMLHSKLPDTANFDDKQSDTTATDNEPVADESADNQAEQAQEAQDVANDLDNKEQVAQNEQTDEQDAQDQNTLEQETNTQETSTQEADTQEEQNSNILPRVGLATGVVASALAAMSRDNKADDSQTGDNQAENDTQETTVDGVDSDEMLAQNSLQDAPSSDESVSDELDTNAVATQAESTQEPHHEMGDETGNEADKTDIQDAQAEVQGATTSDDQKADDVAGVVATQDNKTAQETEAQDAQAQEETTKEAETKATEIKEAEIKEAEIKEAEVAKETAQDTKATETTKDDTKVAAMAVAGTVAGVAAVGAKSVASESKAQPTTTAQSTSQVKPSAQPNSTNTTQDSNKKESNIFKSLLPIIGLLVIGAVAAMLVKNQQKEPTPIAKPQPSTEQISAINPASFALALNNTGDKIYACSADVGNPILGEQIRAAVSSLFDAKDCRFNVNSAINKDMPIAMYVPQILGFMKGVPDATIRVSDKQVTLNSSSLEALQTLVSNVTIALPDDFKIVAEPNLDSSLEVTESIEMSKKALDELGDDATSDDIAHALNQQIINFDENSSQIPEANKAVLDKAANHLKANPTARLTITGHTDDQGTPEQKQQLSTKRAEAVRDYLVKQGVNTEKLSVKGSGGKQPVASNATEKGRFQNSRIEFTTEQPTTQTLVDNSTRTVKQGNDAVSKATKASESQKPTQTTKSDETTGLADTISANDVNIIQEPSDKMGDKSSDKSGDEPLALAPTAKPTKDSKPSAQLIQTEPNGATCPPCNCTCGGE